MKKKLMGALLLGCAVSTSQAVQLSSATFVPGHIGASIAQAGATSVGAEPEQRFAGCVQHPKRLFFGTQAQTGQYWPVSNDGLRNFLTLLLAARDAGKPVTVSYFVAPSGYCYYRSISF